MFSVMEGSLFHPLIHILLNLCENLVDSLHGGENLPDALEIFPLSNPPEGGDEIDIVYPTQLEELEIVQGFQMMDGNNATFLEVVTNLIRDFGKVGKAVFDDVISFRVGTMVVFEHNAPYVEFIRIAKKPGEKEALL